MNENLQQLDQYIAYLAEKLQKPTEVIYDLLLRQVYFEGAWAAVWMLVGVVLFIVSYFGYKKLNVIAEDYCEDGIQTLVFIPVVLGGCFFFINLKDILQIAINPHWYMIQIASELVK